MNSIWARLSLISLVLGATTPAALAADKVVDPSQFTVATFNMEWFGLNGSPSNSVGSETRTAADLKQLNDNHMWADVMAFEEIVDVNLLETQIVGSNYRCESYTVADPKHQHVVICVRNGFTLEKAADDDNFALEDVAMTTLRPAVHGVLKTANGTPLAHIVALHLKANQNQGARRLAQTELLGKYLSTVDPSLPILILGDLNTFGDDVQKMLDSYATHGLNLTEAENDATYTYRTAAYAQKFDRMFTRGLELVSPVRVAGPCNLAADDVAEITAYNHAVSDHCPVIAQFSLAH